MENINYVTQDPFLFNMSIRKNILVGNPDASEEAVVRAARVAQCDEFISELEHGYDTIAGDAGTKLSGGQRQRIIIARAILRNAPVLILDEAHRLCGYGKSAEAPGVVKRTVQGQDVDPQRPSSVYCGGLRSNRGY